jgi:glutathione synthase/RimK-type ligase-like ATP-grasp enzyme
MNKEVLLTGNFTLNFTQHNVGHYVDACKELGYTARVVNSQDMHNETELPFAAINMAGYPNETHKRFLRKLELQGVKVVNPVYNAAIADDKALSNLEMAGLGLPVPKTMDLHVSSFDRSIPVYVRDQIGYPCVIKHPRMGYGMGIHLARTEDEFTSIFDLLALCSSKSANYMSNTNLVVQQFIPETESRQVKVFVLDKKIVGAYYYQNSASWRIGRTGPVDVPRTDNAPGGKVIFELREIDAKLAEQCIYVMDALKLTFACIDVFFGPDGFLFNEINTSPGFHRCYPERPMAHLVMDHLVNS